MKKKIEVSIEPPSVPSFLRNVVKGREKAILIPIQDLTESELRQIGEERTDLLIKQAAKRRKSNKQ